MKTSIQLANVRLANVRLTKALFWIASLFVLSTQAQAALPACRLAGVGSADPNEVLRWTLITGENTRCAKEVRPPDNWTNLGGRVVVRPKHGTAGFDGDVHFNYAPRKNYAGRDSFTIEIDRRIRDTGESARRIITFDVSVVGAKAATSAQRARVNDPVRQCLMAVNRSHPVMQGPMRGYIEESAYNVYLLDADKCYRLK